MCGSSPEEAVRLRGGARGGCAAGHIGQPSSPLPSGAIHMENIDITDPTKSRRGYIYIYIKKCICMTESGRNIYMYIYILIINILMYIQTLYLLYIYKVIFK